MIELSIPQPGETSRQAKDLIFTLLTKEKSLSLIQLYTMIKKEYNVSITYQAVRKAVELLVEQTVLIKNEKQYSLSKKWVLELKSFFDELLASFDSQKSVHTFSSTLIKDNYASYTLHSLYDLDVFWGDVLLHLAKNLKKGEPKLSVNYGHYVWWMLINLGRETKLYEVYKQLKIQTYFIWLRDLPLNRLATTVYERIGHRVCLQEDENVDECVAFDTVGDTVIEVRYPKKIVRKIKQFFETYTTLQDMDMKRLTAITHEPCDIQFIVYRNKELARSISETYLKYFS
jgi:hypothetical protein